MNTVRGCNKVMLDHLRGHTSKRKTMRRSRKCAVSYIAREYAENV